MNNKELSANSNKGKVSGWGASMWIQYNQDISKSEKNLEYFLFWLIIQSCKFIVFHNVITLILRDTVMKFITFSHFLYSIFRGELSKKIKIKSQNKH